VKIASESIEWFRLATLNFNANDVEPSVGFDPIPAGKYQALITDSEMKPTKNGDGQYLELAFEIIKGDYRSRKVWARLKLENRNAQAAQIARADLSAICRAVNVIQPRDNDQERLVCFLLMENYTEKRIRSQLKITKARLSISKIRLALALKSAGIRA